MKLFTGILILASLLVLAPGRAFPAEPLPRGIELGLEKIHEEILQRESARAGKLGQIPSFAVGAEPVESRYISCDQTLHQLKARGLYYDGYTPEEAACAQQHDMMPVSGFLRRNFEDIADWQRASDFATKVGQERVKQLRLNEQFIQIMIDCVDKMSSWDKPLEERCEKLSAYLGNLTRTELPKLRKHLTYMIDGPQSPFSPEDLSAHVNSGMTVPRFIPRHQDDPVAEEAQNEAKSYARRAWDALRAAFGTDAYEKATPEEAKAASDEVRDVAIKAQEEFKEILAKKAEKYKAAGMPQSLEFQVLKGQIDSSPGLDALKINNSQWRAFLRHRFEDLRARHNREFVDILTLAPVLGYIKVRDPKPHDFAEALRRQLATVRYNIHRLGKVMDQLKDAKSVSMDPILDLTEYGDVVDRTLLNDPKDCAIAEAIASRRDTRKQQWDLLEGGMDLAFIASGLVFGMPVTAGLVVAASGTQAADLKAAYDKQGRALNEAFASPVGPDKEKGDFYTPDNVNDALKAWGDYRNQLVQTPGMVAGAGALGYRSYRAYRTGSRALRVIEPVGSWADAATLLIPPY